MPVPAYEAPRATPISVSYTHLDGYKRQEEIGDRQRRLRADGRVREQHEHGERREGDAHERQLAAEVLAPGARGARRAVALVEKAQAEVENRQLEGNEVLELSLIHI